MFLEAACFLMNDAYSAIECKVDRIEYCHDYSCGGVSPCVEDIVILKDKTDIPIYVMVRPRSGLFIYSDDEIRIMQQQIKLFKEAGADGFVFGCLYKDDEVDEYRNQKLLNSADGLPCTFHRAFDAIANKNSALELLISIGFSAVLTSGGRGSAIDNATTIRELEGEFGQEIDIIAGGGVRSQNLHKLIRSTACTWYHSAARVGVADTLSKDEVLELKKILHEI
jgi:copper homeostasis protein